jgi:hypothetical protein
MRTMQSLTAATIFTAIGLIFGATAGAQDKTLPPASEHPVLTLHAIGSQVYSCQRNGDTIQWTFIAPAARLFDDAGNEVATHGDGPVWNYQDSSSIQGVVQQKSPSPDPNSIPWLLLKAVNPARTGILTTVDFIRRSDTHGGIAPTTGCDAQHIDANVRVPYTATYTFYSAKP